MAKKRSRRKALSLANPNGYLQPDGNRYRPESEGKQKMATFSATLPALLLLSVR